MTRIGARAGPPFDRPLSRSSLERMRRHAQIRGTVEAIMAELNHLIVWSRDKHASAKFLGDMLGVPFGAEWWPFVPVRTSNGVTIDFVDGENEVRMQHYAFLVDDAEFDAAFARIRKAGLTYWADPHKGQPGEINHHWGGRG